MKVYNKKAIIITPYKLDTKQRSAIVKAFPYLEKAGVENIQDKSLIGGFILKYGSTVFDASIKGAVDDLADKLYEIDR